MTCAAAIQHRISPSPKGGRHETAATLLCRINLYCASRLPGRPDPARSGCQSAWHSDSLVTSSIQGTSCSSPSTLPLPEASLILAPSLSQHGHSAGLRRSILLSWLSLWTGRPSWSSLQGVDLSLSVL